MKVIRTRRKRHRRNETRTSPVLSMRPGSCTFPLLLGLLLIGALLPSLCVWGYTLDQEHNLQFKGPEASMFGYSVLLHRHKSHSWLVVGAPVANSSNNTLPSPGAVYRCSLQDPTQRCVPMGAEVTKCGKTCEGESAHQWLGVSLSRQPGAQGGHVLACAHRWKNVYYSQRDGQNNKLPNGVCFRYGQDLKHGHPYIPCYRDHQRKFGEEYGSCQAGISNVFTQDLIIMGAPGTSYWTGSVLVLNISSGVLSSYVDDHSATVSFGSYLGYSVGAGQFLSPSSMEVVGGAPQHNQRGKVFIFSVDRNTLRVLTNVSGKELGSYFGASLCVLDLNADGLSDLLVGAPMATGVSREEGRVHVYLNQGQAELQEAEFLLSGSEAYAARFGEAIADLGDLDDDGYPDVAVGAPHEDELRGAVYIYNGRQDGISPNPSQRITGASLGRELSMFGQSLNSGVDIDNNGYQDVAVGAFLSDSAVILRSRPVVRVEASVHLPEHVDQQVALCSETRAPTVCMNVSVCFQVSSRQFKGAVDLLYNVTSDLLHKPSFPHRFYFHGNGSSNSTRGRVRARLGQPTCNTHLAFLRQPVRDIFTPVRFQASFSLREAPPTRSHRPLPPLRPILQRDGAKSASAQTLFSRSCLLDDCSTDLQLSAQLVLPGERQYFPLGWTRSFMVNASVVNAGDDSFLPRLTLLFPPAVQYVRVYAEEMAVSCDIIAEVNSTVGVACGVVGLLLPAQAQLNVSFMLDVSHNSTPSDVILQLSSRSENFEKEEFLRDNSVSLVLPLRQEMDMSIHGHVSPSSFTFSELEEDYSPVDCYTEALNFTYKVVNSGPSRSLDTVVEVLLPRSLIPYPHRLLQITDWQVSQGECTIVDRVLPVQDDCLVPHASLLQQLVFFFSPPATRLLFCAPRDPLCERMVCNVGPMEAGRVATIHLETKLNPAVLLQAPGRHRVMKLESVAFLLRPVEDQYTVMTSEKRDVQAQVVALFSQNPSAAVRVLLLVVSLILGLLILSVLIYCLWKAGFFKRELQQKKMKRDSWDYVPKLGPRESFS
ncbi:integrin alpha-4 [Periophthalmus magnuspinnatus]|uniref:integrin alpha-4 n=1 Tax=Periophthalmus magnuspinnatus TaxID=409849 RepID=UPI002436AFEB|nr:integrin alpha-4 [Periophthalmus magnuspinnatus]